MSWAIVDKSSGAVDELDPGAVDADSDPDGADGGYREELLPWILDRHLELGSPEAGQRGTVEGGAIEFRLEYVGKRGREALRRPAGAHHKLARILGRTLLYEPHRLVYVLPCDLYVAVYDPSQTQFVKTDPRPGSPNRQQRRASVARSSAHLTHGNSTSARIGLPPPPGARPTHSTTAPIRQHDRRPTRFRVVTAPRLIPRLRAL